MCSFSFCLFKNLLRFHSQFESIINRSIERIQLFSIHLLLSSPFIYLHCIFFLFAFTFLLAFVFLFNFSFSSFLLNFPLSFSIFPFLHNISWITITSSLLHFREGSSSHKKISFPLFFCILSIHCFPSNFFRFIVSFILFVFLQLALTYGVAAFDLLNVSSILNITLRFTILSSCSCFVIFSGFLILLLPSFSFFFCDLWGPVCCLSVLYIFSCLLVWVWVNDTARRFLMIIYACWVSGKLRRQAHWILQ